MRMTEWFRWSLDTETGVAWGDWPALEAFLLDDGEYPTGATVTITNLSGVDDD